ncbi:MAG: amino acid deaminase [Alphaproteobacteria bacterium]|nr:amino acid deaminase [Alphaproteobacteria bacterium]
MIDLGEILASTVDERTKGFPGGIGAMPVGEIGKRGWNLLREDVPLPAAVLKRSALEHNSKWMRAFLARTGARIAPHGKTPMSPQLFDRQLADGAWAITLATPQQVQVARHYGVKRIVMANQLIGRQAVRYVLAELKRDPSFDFYCLVDSLEGVESLAAAARDARIGRPLQVLLEGGMQGGRTGVRDLAAAMKVARAVKAAAPDLALRGVEGFEGLLSGKDAAKGVQAFLDFLVAIARAVEGEGLFAQGPVLLTAGGSAYFDLVAETFAGAGLKSATQVITRSGCYLAHDSQHYTGLFTDMLARTPALQKLGLGLRPAVEVWSYVQSRPEPGKCLLTMGRRDVGTDVYNPLPELWYRPGLHNAPVAIPGDNIVTGLNDQHTHMAIDPSSPLKVGDMVSFGVSHPCTTFDKWQLLYEVDDDYNIVAGIRTFF